MTLTDSYNNQTVITRSSGNITKITSSDGHETLVSLDSNGYLASVTNPASEVRQMTYYSGGLLQTFKKGKVNGSTVAIALTSTFSYDSGGKLLNDTNSTLPSSTYVAQLLATQNSATQRTIDLTSATGKVTSFSRTNMSSYDPSAIKLTTVAPNGFTSERNLSSTLEQYSDYVITETSNKTNDARFQAAASFVSSYSYAPVAQPTRILDRTQAVSLNNASDVFDINTLTVTEVANYDSTNRTNTTVYSGSTKTFTTTTPAGRTYVETINNFGLPTQVSYGTFYPVSLTYDTKGRVSGISQNTRSVSVTYGTAGTANGRVLTITNPLSQTTTFAYDSAGRVTTQTLPDTRQIGFSYDSNGNIASVTPPGRPAHSLSVNVLDLLTGYTAPTVSSQTPVTTYAYNNDKELTSVTRPNGDVVTLSYGTSGDATGRLESVGSPQGTISYGWSQWYPAPVTIDSYDNIRLTNTYSGDWIREQTVTDTSTSSPLGTVSLTLNSDTLQDSETVTPPSGQGSAVTINYTYDNDGLMTGAGAMTFGRNSNNGTVMTVSIGTISETRTHNQYGENMSKTVKRGSTTRYSYTLTRDALGRVATKSENVNGTTTTFTYTYDSAGRLTDVVRSSGGNSSHTYDPNSNRTSGTTKGVSYTATYDNQDRLLTYGSYSYGHNLNGDRTSVANTTTSVTTNSTFDAFGNLRSVGNVSYMYDGRGRRVARLVSGVIQERYLYRNQLQIAAITNANGQVQKKFVYGDSHAPEYFIVYNYSTNTETTYRLVTDNIGTVRIVLKTSDGSVAQQIEYDEWGRIVSNSNPTLQPYAFAGGLYDTTTKLLHFGARDYDPETGRWVTKDPIRFRGGDSNLYGYVLQDPINKIDPTGLMVTCVPVYLSGMYLCMDGETGKAIFRDGKPEGGICGLIFCSYENEEFEQSAPWRLPVDPVPGNDAPIVSPTLPPLAGSSDSSCP